MKKILGIVLAAVIMLCAVVGFRWYSYVTNTTDAYDELGIELQGFMPAPLRNWGCQQLKKNFGEKSLPPYGCAKPEDGREWLQ